MKPATAWSLARETLKSWSDDYASSMGAALAYYTMFSIAPLLLIVISVAGLFFGEQAARGEILDQLQGLMGADGAQAVQALLASVNHPQGRHPGHAVRHRRAVVGATTVIGELQNSLDRIWRAPRRDDHTGVFKWFRTRLMSLGMIMGIGFLLMVSLVASALLATVQRWFSRYVDFGAAASAVDFVAQLLLHHGGLRDDLQADAAGAHRVARRQDRRGGHVTAVHGRARWRSACTSGAARSPRPSARPRRWWRWWCGCTGRRRSSCWGRSSRGCMRGGAGRCGRRG